MKYFLFLDLETTGTDETTDAILECAWVITNEHFVPMHPGRTFPVHIDEGHTIASLVTMSDFVRDMHTTSGLLDELDSGATLDHVFEQLVSDIDRFVGPDDTLHLSGFSVHFDKDFLKANDFEALFRDGAGGRKARIHHRHLDLSSVKMIVEAAGLTEHIGYDANVKPHRALWDCDEALQYAIRVRGFLGLVAPYPPMAAEQDLLDDLDPDVVTVDLTKYEGNL
jgi:oligoribonuclease